MTKRKKKNDGKQQVVIDDNSIMTKKKKKQRLEEEEENATPLFEKNNIKQQPPLLLLPNVIQWLELRKKKIPKSLLLLQQQKDGDDDELIKIIALDDNDKNNMDQILKQLLPNLKERELRSLKRYVEKKKKQQNDLKVDANEKTNNDVLEESDGEYEIKKEDDPTVVILPKIHGSGGTHSKSSHWPSHVTFSNNYQWDTTTTTIPETYVPKNKTIRLRAARPSCNVRIKVITDPHHPACGEYGLFSTRDFAPGSWLLDYVGTVSKDQDPTSDYVSDFGEQSELACDAKLYGNEARFINDFRNTGKFPNVEFNIRRDARGELRQGVYVKLAKDVVKKKKNKKKNDDNDNDDVAFNGIKKDEELLVTYGKSYWRSRVGNLTDFVWRLPGQPPTTKKPSPK